MRKNNGKVVEIVLSGASLLSLKDSSFKDNEIIDVRVSLSTGKLDNIKDNVVLLPKVIYHEEVICDLNNDILKLNDYVDKGYKVRIWSSHLDADSYLLLLFICNVLNNKVDSLGVLYSDEYNKDCYSLGMMTGAEVDKLSNYEQTLNSTNIKILSDKWSTISSSNSDLRIIENGEVKSISYDYFDVEILTMIKTNNNIRIIDVCYELSKKYHINDSVFIFLITRLIDIGKIKIIKKDEKFIKSTIEINN